MCLYTAGGKVDKVTSHKINDILYAHGHVECMFTDDNDAAADVVL